LKNKSVRNFQSGRRLREQGFFVSASVMYELRDRGTRRGDWKPDRRRIETRDIKDTGNCPHSGALEEAFHTYRQISACEHIE
jgi:hypothetical protein